MKISRPDFLTEKKNIRRVYRVPIMELQFLTRIHVKRPAILTAVLEQPVNFREMGNPEACVPVKVLFLLAIKEQDKQVNVLSDLIEKIIKARHELKSIVEAKSGAEIYQILNSLL